MFFSPPSADCCVERLAPPPADFSLLSSAAILSSSDLSSDFGRDDASLDGLSESLWSGALAVSACAACGFGLACGAGTVLGVGRLLAFAAGRGLAISGSASGLTFDFHLLPWQWGVLAALPLVVALVAMMTARITVLRSLARMP